MRKFKVTLEQQERDSLVAITQKGNHRSRKVVNALILLNCDQGRFQNRWMRNEDVAAVLKISMRKIDRVKKRFVEEGLEVALHGRKGQRVYEKKADGDFEAHLVALSCSQPPEGFSQWSLRLLADRVVELNYIDSISYETVRRVLKKKRNQALEKERVGHSARAKR
jgi:transposase